MRLFLALAATMCAAYGWKNVLFWEYMQRTYAPEVLSRVHFMERGHVILNAVLATTAAAILWALAIWSAGKNDAD